MAAPQTQPSEEQTRREALEALGTYQKRGSIETRFHGFAESMTDESDRGVVVITASLMEDLLLDRLMREFAGANAIMEKDLTRGGALLSNFADKISLAFALGTIDQEVVDMLGFLKAMRNACAHSRRKIDFETPELKTVLALMYEGEDRASVLAATNKIALRIAFMTATTYLFARIRGYDQTESGERASVIMKSAQDQADKAVAKFAASQKKRAERSETLGQPDPKD